MMNGWTGAAGLTLAAVVFGLGPGPQASPYKPPKVIKTECLGPLTFEDTFKSLDAGPDQIRPAKPHRWRTVYGYGGALALDNRNGGRAGVAVDPSFTGVKAGAAGAAPLGLNPFSVDPATGALVVRAEPAPAEMVPLLWGKRYTTGLLTTKFSFSQRYGYFEINAKLPRGKGLWPAFWLLPNEGKWPAGGELDIFEQLGHEPETMYFSVHSGAQKTIANKVTLAADASRDFHLYGAAWTPGEVVWYVDRKEVARTTTPADMNKPMHMIIDLAVGGSWGGDPDETTRFPADLKVLAVRAWALPDSEAGRAKSGRACESAPDQ
uniref:Glycoside hydrolase family 16 n=1 Tax=Caulobacter sp. (strain K31) TaxID=366602 RepID=B0T429_CAUSK